MARDISYKIMTHSLYINIRTKDYYNQHKFKALVSACMLNMFGFWGSDSVTFQQWFTYRCLLNHRSKTEYAKCRRRPSTKELGANARERVLNRVTQQTISFVSNVVEICKSIGRTLLNHSHNWPLTKHSDLQLPIIGNCRRLRVREARRSVLAPSLAFGVADVCDPGKFWKCQ
jgi:hypothetical protein